MHTPKDKTTAFEIIKNYLPVIFLIGGGFISIVAFWYDSKAVARKVDTNKAETDARINAIDDKVTRQYGTQRDMNDKTNKEVDELKLWKSFMEGYRQAEKDLKK